ncbi:MAG: hypothetical protein COA79_06320 [Planctomycetota bacterium]|nr:MAG: hypothetical protein COA79_06320 [Planctomycetota bacterium]
MEFHRYPTLLTDVTHKRLSEIYLKRKKIIEKIKTQSEALKYQNSIKNKIKKCFGKFPKKTPLKYKVTKVLIYKGYTVECLKYESRPDFWVSANLYLPKIHHGNLPAILLPCGHNQSGKAAPFYVEACVRLVQEGYAVLIYDPINQGERKLYSLTGFPQENNKGFNATIGHNHIGKQLRACGESLCSWFVWDGIRGVDYLFTRPEIDKKRIGITGNSGGGALSAYQWALDKRISMVASSCWTTSYLYDLENEMPGDNEQYPRGFLAEGLDKIDFFISRAGEPTILLGQERDFFDDRGLKEGYQDLLKFHKLLGGQEKSCQLQMDVITHSYSSINQKALIKFFNRALGLKRPSLKEFKTQPQEKELYVTKTGDLHKDGSTPLYKLTAELSKIKKSFRKRGSRNSLIKKVEDVLNLRMPKSIPAYRRTHGEGRWNRKTKDKKFNIFRFVVESENNIYLPLRHITNSVGPFRLDTEKEINLILPNLCSQSEFLNGSIKSKGPCWLLDVRGMGEGLFVADDTSNHYGMEYLLAGHGFMFRDSLLGQRIFDVLSIINLFKSEGVKKIHLQGYGQGGIIALITALLDNRINSVSCIKTPESFEKLVSSSLCYWPDVNFPFNVLDSFDLPDIRSVLGKRLVKSTYTSPEGKHFV